MTAALAEVKLGAAVLERYPFQLSGGMCQRVLIAIAFSGNPALVVADEPTTALDVSTQATIVQIMRRLQRDHGTALLFITHDLRLAAHVCDEIAVLYAGEIVERGPARDVSRAPRHPYTRALQAANPPLGGTLSRLVTLPDQMPGLEALGRLPGCRFTPRCPTAIPPAATRRHPFAKSRPAITCAARRPAAALLPRPRQSAATRRCRWSRTRSSSSRRRRSIIPAGATGSGGVRRASMPC